MITEQELKRLIETRADIEKLTTLSSDGKNLLTRVPKDVREYLGFKKGDKIRWLVDLKKQIKIEVVR